MDEVMISKIKAPADFIGVLHETIRQIALSGAADAFEPKKIIRSGDRTIVFLADGSKTIVKRDPEDADNLHTAYCAALAKKVHGSNSRIKKIISRKLVENKREKRHEEA